MLDINRCHVFTDTIHGCIPYSGIESEIIGSPIFNRLHKVLQNSLVYLTFPSNKSKRFEHSIGTMHLAGKMFYYSICNSSKPCIHNLLEEIHTEIINWVESISCTDHIYLPSDGFSKDHGNYYHLHQFNIPNSSLYHRYIPSNVTEKDKYIYLIAYQSIRICGLLHDIGHLPYSHILEKSLKKLFNIINEKQTKLSGYEDRFLSTMRDYIEKGELHEELGIRMIKTIKEIITLDLVGLQDENLFLFPASFYLAEKILSSKSMDNTIFSDLHKLVASDFDADRLDYCSRDLFSTGVDKDIINYERIIGTYIIAVGNYEQIDEKPTRKRFLFCPAAKTIQEIEAVLLKRWKIYTTINYHHNVHKHEIIMQKCIVELGLRVLQKEEEKIKDSEGQLEQSVSAFWNVCELYANMQDSNMLQCIFLQLDDSWLDNVLRQALFDIYKESPFSIRKNGTDILWNRLFELISAKKRYYSVLKHVEDFSDFDKMFRNELITHEGFASLLEDARSTKSQKDSTVATIGIRSLLDFLEILQNTEYDIVGLFVFNRIYAIISTCFDSTKGVSYLEAIESDLNKQAQKLQITDALIGDTQCKTGYDRMHHPLLVYKMSANQKLDILEISELSNQAQQFITEKERMPAFHLFVQPSANNIDMNMIRIALAKSAASLAIERLNKGLIAPILKK